MPPKPLQYSLRKATDHDYAFIEQLYIETSEPLLSAFDAWDKEATVNSFRKIHYRVDEAKIIMVAGRRAGWLQIREDDDQIALHQLHIKSGYRDCKIGTHFIIQLIRQSHKKGKKTTLSVYKNNRALDLYIRLGFSIISKDETKFHLSNPPKCAN